jgi:hypothetical protein
MHPKDDKTLNDLAGALLGDHSDAFLREIRDLCQSELDRCGP